MIEWNVYNEVNQEIKIYNVFKHAHFVKSLVDMFKELKKSEEKWLDDELDKGLLELGYYTRLCKHIENLRDEKLDNICKYQFRGRCEYELILTDWPTSIAREEIYRLVDEDKEYFNKYGTYLYRFTPNLCVGKKIDIYDQLKLNWEQFKFYILMNEREIKKLYKTEYRRYFKK